MLKNIKNRRFWRKKRLYKYKLDKQLKNSTRYFSLVFKLLVLAVIIFVLYFLFFSDYFQIRQVEVKGAQKNNPNEIIKFAQDSMSGRFWGIISNKNIFVYDKQALLKELYQEYVLENIVISKKLPDVLEIVVQERYGRLIWVTDNKYFLIDLDGIVLRELSRPKKNLTMPIFQLGSDQEAVQASANQSEIGEQDKDPEAQEKEKFENDLKSRDLTNQPFYYDLSNQQVFIGAMAIEKEFISKISQILTVIEVEYQVNKIEFNKISREINFVNNNYKIKVSLNQDPENIKKYLKAAQDKNFQINEYLDLRLIPNIYYK